MKPATVPAPAAARGAPVPSTSAGTRAIFITLLELLHLVWVLVSTEPWGNMDYNSIGTLDLSSLWLCDVAAP